MVMRPIVLKCSRRESHREPAHGEDRDVVFLAEGFGGVGDEEERVGLFSSIENHAHSARRTLARHYGTNPNVFSCLLLGWLERLAVIQEAASPISVGLATDSKRLIRMG
jgi:hypothetical protein